LEHKRKEQDGTHKSPGQKSCPIKRTIRLKIKEEMSWKKAQISATE
jgi:hypothetical protein